MATASSAGTSAGLAREAIGLREVLFQSVTSMAPAGAVALSIAAGATYAGGALPLSVLLALVACLLVASSIGQLAKHLPSAGSVYTYPAEAIHRPGELFPPPHRGRMTGRAPRARARLCWPARDAAAMRVRSMMSRCAWLPPTALGRRPR